ncbi:MAG: adenylate/guanylate cyclase domain-containing protein [Jaaginema sp. PMC 1079.18]|nr:adenylate/guanylate cyclase domain-containing protein [Jaaginema sp. PMC 1080.18]MEC4851624.1 adenylate/guanylate cyclase domain-containing protein [Jaaginema sp. PMC 1079.18]MEC4867548.1 adenylate/guanylate cyclase domain-containing protein [Jaaginema sp. PMC 1078.18]
MAIARFLSSIICYKARLSRKIASWVFLSIIGVEVAILIPSYWLEQERQLEKLEIDSQAAVKAIIALNERQMTEKNFRETVTVITDNSKVLTGITIYDLNGQKVAQVGETARLTFDDINNEFMVRLLSPDKQRYDVAWSSESLGFPYVLISSHNASNVPVELRKFTLRIAGLVLIISIFVTAATMIVLGILVIQPILKIRQDLLAAGEALSQDQTDVKFYAINHHRNDELGDVMRAFCDMFNRVSTEIAMRKKTENKLRSEKKKSEKLLLNILPKTIADRLKEKEGTIAQEFPEVTILFADIVGFTQLSSQINPETLVELLNDIFSRFDSLTEQYSLEKIKTIGDSYMVAGGLPLYQPNHADAIASMALDMLDEIKQFQQQSGMDINIRIGINTGPVVAGVIGKKKFIYDLWGDAVNTASRMESHGLPGCIQVTESTYYLLKDRYIFQERGCLTIKGKGMMRTYFLIKKTPEFKLF